MEACTLELYQKNIFRITRLPVDATPKEVARQAQKLQMMEEMGGSDAAPPSAFALTPPATTEQIRDALARMKEPEVRLVDEFFWYWPEQFGASKDDAAIQALLRGDGQSAIDLWVERENEGSLVAKHNLAVMFHMFAVDWTNYHVAYGLEEDRDDKIKGYWGDSFGRWEELVDSDDVWNLLKERVQSLEDEALTTGFVRRMRNVLPQALDRINAEAALQFAVQERMDWAQYHVEFMRQTHAGQDDVASTAELVLGPTRKRLEQELNSTEAQGRQHPESGSELAADLMQRCRPLMGIYDLFHGPEAHQRNDLFDLVAKTVLQLLLDHQKATNDNRSFVELTTQALHFATGSHIRERLIQCISFGEHKLAGETMGPLFASLHAIADGNNPAAVKLTQMKKQVLPLLPGMAMQVGVSSAAYREMVDSVANVLRNIGIEAHNKSSDFGTSEVAMQLALKLAVDEELKKRIQGDVAALQNSKRNALCHFCGSAPGASDAALQLMMFGNVQRHFMGDTNFSRVSVPIARCVGCKGLQDRAEHVGCAGWVACMAVGALVFGANSDDGWIGGLMFGGFIGWIMHYIIQAICKVSTKLKDPATHPEVIKLKAQGWRVGEKPGRFD
jgi:hypothetical protein